MFPIGIAACGIKPDTGFGILLDGDDASMSVGVPLFFLAMLFDNFAGKGIPSNSITSSPSYETDCTCLNPMRQFSLDDEPLGFTIKEIDIALKHIFAPWDEKGEHAKSSKCGHSRRSGCPQPDRNT